MGCSSSLNLPSNKKQPLCNGVLMQDGISNRPTVKSSQTVDHQNHNTYPNNTQNRDNINHINNTEIVIFAHDARDSHRTSESIVSTDSSSVVPILNNDAHPDSGLNNYNSCLNGYGDHRKETTLKDANSNNVHGVKSVLKTNRNDIPSHMIASRPIKSVTFVDSVTVVTVY